MFDSKTLCAIGLLLSICIPAPAQVECLLLYPPLEADVVEITQFEELRIAATARREGIPIRGEDIYLTAIVERADGAIERVSLHDSGELAHQDERRGDGVFTNVLKKTDVVGEYNIASIKTWVHRHEQFHSINRRVRVIGGPPALTVSVEGVQETLASVELTITLTSEYEEGPQTVTLESGSGLATIDPQVQTLNPGKPAQAIMRYSREDAERLVKDGTLRDELIITAKEAEERLVKEIEVDRPPPPTPWWYWLIAAMAVVSVGSAIYWFVSQPPPLTGILKLEVAGQSGKRVDLTRLRTRRVVLGNVRGAHMHLPDLPKGKRWTIAALRDRQMLRLQCPRGVQAETVVNNVTCAEGRSFKRGENVSIEIGNHKLQLTQFG